MVTVSSFQHRRRSARQHPTSGPQRKRSSVSREKLALQLLAALVVVALLVTGGLWAAGVFSDPAEVRAIRSMVDEQVARYDPDCDGEWQFLELQ